MTEIRLKGGAELSRFLEQLPVKLEKNVLRGALRAGANVIRDDARSRVPAKSGKLRRAIKTDTVTGGGQVKARIKLRGKHSFLGVFMEYGVSPHLINAGDSPLTARTLNKHVAKAGAVRQENGLTKINAFEITRNVRSKVGLETRVIRVNQKFIRGAVHHPGHAPKPFLRPALDARASDAVQAVGDYLANRLRIGDFSAPRLELDEE